jgi:hypothetical protein
VRPPETEKRKKSNIECKRAKYPNEPKHYGAEYG